MYVPDEIESYEIPQGTKIIRCACFSSFDPSRLKEVVIPETVETIEDLAFAGCENLRRINIPEEVVSIGEYVFYRVGMNFETVETEWNLDLPDSVSYIGKRAFDSSRMGQVSLPSGITRIEGGVRRKTHEGEFRLAYFHEFRYDRRDGHSVR